MARLTERLNKLEAKIARRESANMRVILLNQDDPLPDRVTGEEDDVLVVRFVSPEGEAA